MHAAEHTRRHQAVSETEGPITFLHVCLRFLLDASSFVALLDNGESGGRHVTDYRAIFAPAPTPSAREFQAPFFKISGLFLPSLHPPTSHFPALGRRYQLFRSALHVLQKAHSSFKMPRGRPAPANTSRKRKATEEPAEPTKKVKVALNTAPTEKLHVFVCGSGESGELGLGVDKKAINVKRPRLNANLAADKVGVVQVATGGMHCLSLTHDNKILSWGVNDQGALGRDTTWDGGLRDVDDDKSDASSDSGDDTGLNPLEATPTAIPSEHFPDGTVITQVAAGDSCSFALTEEGKVYGWGTFRVSWSVIFIITLPFC